MRRALLLALLVANLVAVLATNPGVLQAQTAKRPAITGIAFARFYTTQPDAAQKFFGDTLGYQRLESGTTWTYPVNGSQWVEVLTSPPPPEPNVRMAAVGFTTRNAAELEKYLTAHGVKTEIPLKGGEFGVRDPEGNLVIFVQAGSNKAVAKAPVSPNAVSHRIIHVGFIVRDAAKEDAFWRDILGFHPYWHGGRSDTVTDWQSAQVPDGVDWVEYMLNASATPSLKQAGVMDHFSLGVTHMPEAIAQLQKNKCEDASCTQSKVGRDGKTQVNLYDPDLTRAELMEFLPVQEPCCSPFAGKHPGPEESK
jgi:catechol 2,3-dioxygenase-like lactoylglutathione lyase family enzyme